MLYKLKLVERILGVGHLKKKWMKRWLFTQLNTACVNDRAETPSVQPSGLKAFLWNSMSVSSWFKGLVALGDEDGTQCLAESSGQWFAMSYGSFVYHTYFFYNVAV